jgi:hypothetical protein
LMKSPLLVTSFFPLWPAIDLRVGLDRN